MWAGTCTCTCGLAHAAALITWEHYLMEGLTHCCVPLSRKVTGSAYDPELLKEQEPLVGGESWPPSPPRAPLDMPLSLQRAHTEHPAALPDARQGDCSYHTSLHIHTDTPPCALLPHESSCGVTEKYRGGTLVAVCTFFACIVFFAISSCRQQGTVMCQQYIWINMV